MLLWSDDLAVVPATIHVPLAAVPRLLSFDLLVETGKIVAGNLVRHFSLPAPRLAFSGLNPHAGEGGHIGREEIEIIAPAIAELRRPQDQCARALSGRYPVSRSGSAPATTSRSACITIRR